MGERSADDSGTEERLDRLESVVQQQNETIREMLPGRRAVLAGGAAAALGFAGGAGSASGQSAAGQIGTESAPVDVEAASVNADDLTTRFPVRDVRDFGVVGDGTTDDTAALDSALEAGGPVRIPQDLTVGITSLDFFSNPVYLFGGGTIKRLDGSYDGEWMIRARHPNSIIENITFDGNKANVTNNKIPALLMPYEDNITVRDCTFINGVGHGIFATAQSDNISLENNKVDGCEGAGIRSKADYIDVFGCKVTDCTEKGLSVTGGGKMVRVVGGRYGVNSNSAASECILVDPDYSPGENGAAAVVGVILTGAPQSNSIKFEAVPWFRATGIYEDITSTPTNSFRTQDVYDSGSVTGLYVSGDVLLDTGSTNVDVRSAVGYTSITDNGTRNTLNGHYIGDFPSFDLASGSESVSPARSGADVYDLRVDPSASASASGTLQGIDNIADPSTRVVVWYDGSGDNLVLSHNDAGATNPLLNESNADITLSSNGDFVVYRYGGGGVPNFWIEEASHTS